MQNISFVKKFITCVLAGLVLGEAMLRQGFTYFRGRLPHQAFAILPFLGVLAGLIYAIIWQGRKTNRPATLAFWQGLIRYGIAFDLSEFGWAKICHRQLVMPGSMLDLPYSSISPADLFWTFFSHSYVFACILAGLEIAGAMLLLFRRTRLAGVFVLLPVLANILMMDIFYDVGAQWHAAIMLAGVLYFLFIEFGRLREFFFSAKDSLPTLEIKPVVKMAIRLSIIYLPLLFIAFAGNPDKYPQLTGKYNVRQMDMVQPLFDQADSAHSPLTVVYFDPKNGCVFQFTTPQRRWNGYFSKRGDHLQIKWLSPASAPAFSGTLSDIEGGLAIRGVMGTDSINVFLEKVHR